MIGLRERKKLQTRATIAATALRLFAERGFEHVTVAEVAAAAEVGERTVFRYFTDKEELLFGEDEAFRAALAEALAAQPEHASPVRALAAAAAAVTGALAGRRDELAARTALIRSSPALRARERVKYADFEAVIADGLRTRGLDADAAQLLARVGVACYDLAVTRWLLDADADAPGLAAHFERSLARVRDVLTLESS